MKVGKLGCVCGLFGEIFICPGQGCAVLSLMEDHFISSTRDDAIVPCPK